MVRGDPAARKEPRRRAPKRGRLLAQQIVDDICDRGLVNGDRLAAEPELREMYGVGRPAFREALRVLEVNGVVVVQPGPGGGPVVSRAAPHDLADTLKLHLQLRGATYDDVAEARVLIEPFLARLTAERRDPEALRHIASLMEEIEAADADDKAAFNAHAGQIHRALGQGSGNGVVDLLGSVLIEIYDDHFYDVVTMPSVDRGMVVRRWRKVVDAILAGRGQEVERTVGDMLRDVTGFISENYPGAARQRVRWRDARSDRSAG